MSIRTVFKKTWQFTLRFLPVATRRKIVYFRSIRKFPNLKNPQSFTEKVNWRLINDRREILRGTCDKLWMQEYASAAGVRTPRQIWHGEDLADLVNVDLPERWVLKPNNSSGHVYFGKGAADLIDVMRMAERWRKNPTSKTYPDEWAYSQARDFFIVEEMLGAPNDDLPDYKFFVFDGDVEIIQVDSERHNGHQRRLYTKGWTPLDVRNVLPLGPVTSPPHSLEKMLEVASRLGKPFDFIRVDLYEFEDEVYFGELTPYPGAGLRPYSPSDLDLQLGRKWNLPVLNSAESI